jgi:RIO kinase 2
MKFDVNILRYLDKDTWRVLVATEMGMKNHEIVPVQLINAIAGLKRGGGFKHIKELLKHKLVHHENKEYDGYRLTPLGYDFLALKAFVNRWGWEKDWRRERVGRVRSRRRRRTADGAQASPIGTNFF